MIPKSLRALSSVALRSDFIIRSNTYPLSLIHFAFGHNGYDLLPKPQHYPHSVSAHRKPNSCDFWLTFSQVGWSRTRGESALLLMARVPPEQKPLKVGALELCRPFLFKASTCAKNEHFPPSVRRQRLRLLRSASLTPYNKPARWLTTHSAFVRACDRSPKTLGELH